MNNLKYFDNGYLKLIIGPMFAGKTTYLINIYNYFIKKNKNILVINNILDNRYSHDNSEVISHNGIKIPCISVKNLNDIYAFNNLDKIDIILINEAQFFKDLVDFTIKELTLKKNIYISGLDGDYKQEKFGHILDLIPLSDSIEKLHAKCNQCKEDIAIFTHRLTDDNKQIIIGTNDIYIPICRKCLYIIK